MEIINQKIINKGESQNQNDKEIINKNQSLYKEENKNNDITEKIIKEEKNNKKDWFPSYFQHNERKSEPKILSLNILLDKTPKETFENGLNLDDKNLKEYYSEKDNKKTIKNNENNDLENNLNLDLISNNIQDKSNDKNKKDKTSVNEEEKLEKDANLFLNLTCQIDKDLLDKIEYAIDEKGNPFSIKNNNIENEKNKTKKPIAFIIQQIGKNDNYLIDIKGKNIPKLDDGYYNYKNDNTRVLIKDFDVQHPELRVYGTSTKNIIFDEKEDDNNLNLPSEIKEKATNSNSDFNIFKTKNIINKNENKDKKLILNKNLLNLKEDFPIKIKKEIFNNQTNYLARKSNEKKYKENQKTFKSQVFYRKIKQRILNDNISFNNREKNRNLETIIRTNNILNKSSGGLYTNRNYKKYLRIETNYNKISFDKSDLLKNKEKNKSSIFNEISNVPFIQEINNITHTTSRINLYRYRKLNKRGGSYGSNYNGIFNLKSLISRNNKTEKKDNFNDKEKESKNIISTVDYKSNCIKKIKINIRNKLNQINNNGDKILDSIPLSTISICNSENNFSKELPSYCNYITYNNDSINNNSIDGNLNNIKNENKIIKIKFNSITKKPSLNQKKFQCSILSKEVSDIISNNKNNCNEINKDINQKKEIFCYENEIKNNEKNINIFKKNYSQRATYEKKLNNLSFKINSNIKGNSINKHIIDIKKNNNSQITPIENNFNEKFSTQRINSKENHLKILKENFQPYFNSKFINNKLSINHKMNSISSLKDINFNFKRNYELKSKDFQNY